jgi:hypothetical protein
LNFEYAAETTPLPGVKFTQDGVNDVQAPAAFNSAAVSTLPDVNVPNSAMLFSPLPAETTGI